VRAFPDRPVVGVGAVILDGTRVVLAKRGHPPLQGEWSLPGGAVELGETLIEALVREVKEEVGLDVEVGPMVEVLDRLHHNDEGRVEYHYVIVDYLCRPQGNCDLSSGSDADAAQWVSVDDLASYRVRPKAVEVIHKALELSLGKPVR
jgi:8-oxo-dGTP diphosphatase